MVAKVIHEHGTPEVADFAECVRTELQWLEKMAVADESPAREAGD